MDRKRKYKVLSGGHKKMRKEFLKKFTKVFLPTAENLPNEEVLENDNTPNTTILVTRPVINYSVPENHSEPLVIDEISATQISNTNHPSISLFDGDNSFRAEKPFDIKRFQSSLASWAVTNNVKHAQIRGLLKIWNEQVPLSNLPNDPRTLLGTPRSIELDEHNYWHYGLKGALNKALKGINNIPDKISLKINSDGFSLSKSSSIECWPILCEIVEFPKVPPSVIGIYCGASKIQTEMIMVSTIILI